jgi:hypothetical protein
MKFYLDVDDGILLKWNLRPNPYIYVDRRIFRLQKRAYTNFFICFEYGTYVQAINIIFIHGIPFHIVECTAIYEPIVKVMWDP